MSYSRRFPPFFTASFFVLSSVALAACGQQSEPAESNEVETTATNETIIPRPQPPLDRAALLSAVRQAASAKAAGSELPTSLASLDGRQFEVRIRFGCRGAAADLENAWLGWTYDPENRTLRIKAKSTISKEDPLVAELAGDDFESVEGFWIPRPWLLQAVCPADAAFRQQAVADDSAGDSGKGESKPKTDAAKTEPKPKPEAPATAQDAEATKQAQDPVPRSPRIGIAQFFTSDDPRTRRRDSRPYSTVKTLPEGSAIPSQGFDLVLSGRLRTLPGRGVIQCITKNADSPPECVISAEFQGVRIERPVSHEIIAEWGAG